MRVPARAPPVTTSWCAARPRFTLAGRECTEVAGPTPRGAATSRLERDPANRSRRITPTTVNTKIHKRMRKPKRATVSTNSGIPAPLSGKRRTWAAGEAVPYRVPSAAGRDQRGRSSRETRLLTVHPDGQCGRTELDHVTRVERD